MVTCDCCQQKTLHSFTQTFPAKYNRPDRTYFECHNPECRVFMQTLSQAEHAKLCKQLA